MEPALVMVRKKGHEKKHSVGSGFTIVHLDSEWCLNCVSVHCAQLMVASSLIALLICVLMDKKPKERKKHTK
jgi:hypothetical protein